MNKEQAEWWVSTLTSLLGERDLVVTYSRTVSNRLMEVYPHQRFREAWPTLDYKQVGVMDTRGAMTGADSFIIDPELYTVYAFYESGYGEPLTLAWTVTERTHAIYLQFKNAQRAAFFVTSVEAKE